MSDKSKKVARGLVLLVLLSAMIPFNQSALAATPLPPVDMFQLPWDQGIAWVAVDGIDNGSDRPTSSSHNYSLGGAIDFAPRITMFTGEDTSNFWVTAAAAGIVIEKSTCHVRIVHEGGWITEYQFLGLVQVQTGDTVARNQRLGIIADGVRYRYCSGYQEPNTPHLHFMLRPTLIGATFAGWQVKYNSFWNNTTFTKDGTTVGLYKPLLNVPLVLPTPTPPATTTPDPSQMTPTPVGSATNTPDPSQPTATPGGPTNTPDPSQPTATLTPDGGATNTPDPSQPTPTPTPANSFITTTVTPASIGVGETAFAAVHLYNVPATGFSSAEFVCTYDPTLIEVSNINIFNLFGNDSVSVINGPQNGTFIVAIAGANGARAVTDGGVFVFDVLALQAGQTTVNCTARVSQGDNLLTPLPSTGTDLTITSAPSTPTFTPTATETPSTGWLTFTNSTYGFEFKYPPLGIIADGRTDTFARIDLPFVPGTNLSDKYLEVIVGENVTECKSPLQTQDPGVTVTINGISFLKQTGAEGAAGSLYQWVAYSARRDNVCVSLDFILRSHDPGNFSTPPPVFDFAAESAIFEQIMTTYAWLALGPTPTPAFTSTPVVSATPITSPVPTITPTATASPTGMISGQVIASKPVTISVYGADNSLVVSVQASLNNSFAVTLSAGTYTVVASASGFLNTQGSFTVTSNLTSTLPTVTLLAGDIDGNNVIDQFDALTIGMSYNTAVPAAADLNNDGIINVLDLELLALNYRKTGPVVWE